MEWDSEAQPRVQMGRQKDWKAEGAIKKRGPGRKVRKQKPPSAALAVGGEPDGPKRNLGGRIRQRARRRVVKAAARALLMERRRKRRERRKDKEEVETPPGFSDENQVWLKPAEGQRKRELLGGSDAEMSCEEEEGNYSSLYSSTNSVCAH